MAIRRVSPGQLSEDTKMVDPKGKGVSEAAIDKIRRGKSANPRRSTLEVLADALQVPLDHFDRSSNDHVFEDTDVDLALLEDQYGPSVRSCITFGPKRTLYLPYDTCAGHSYPESKVFAKVSDKDISFPPAFLKHRAHIEQINENLEKDPSKGRPYFDGPTLAMLGYHIKHTTDGNEEKSICIDLASSRYANNVTAKSRNAANLRRRALRNFEFLDQPIPWLSSGVGVAVVLFCGNAKDIVVCRRSKLERFRSGEFDVSVVEGINPKLDARETGPDIFISDVARRGVHHELGLAHDDFSVQIHGFGLDLEYYQWNFICSATTHLEFHEVKLAWQTAVEKWETSELAKVPSDPAAAAGFAAKNPIWSSGLAALYVSLIKRGNEQRKVASEFVTAFARAHS